MSVVSKLKPKVSSLLAKRKITSFACDISEMEAICTKMA